MSSLGLDAKLSGHSTTFLFCLLSTQLTGDLVWDKRFCQKPFGCKTVLSKRAQEFAFSERREEAVKAGGRGLLDFFFFLTAAS